VLLVVERGDGMKREDCADFEICQRYGKGELDCTDCDDFKATECYEDYGGLDRFERASV